MEGERAEEEDNFFLFFHSLQPIRVSEYTSNLTQYFSKDLSGAVG